jgi:hypothetical protein
VIVRCGIFDCEPAVMQMISSPVTSSADVFVMDLKHQVESLQAQLSSTQKDLVTATQKSRRLEVGWFLVCAAFHNIYAVGRKTELAGDVVTKYQRCRLLSRHRTFLIGSCFRCSLHKRNPRGLLRS